MNPNFIFVIILSITAFLANILMLNMYFWHDDYTALFYLKNNELIFFPYHINILLLRPLMAVFGYNPQGYFLTGIILYVLTTIILYYLLLILFKKRFLAFFSSLIFAVGYIGQEAMRQFTTIGIGTLIGSSGILLTYMLVYKFLTEFRRLWLALSFLTFFITLEVTPYRFGGAIIPILAMLLMLFLRQRKTGNKRYLIIITSSLIYLVIFVLQYFIHPSKIILHYNLAPVGVEVGATGFSSPVEKQYLAVLLSIKPHLIINTVGWFWNSFFPSYYRDELVYFISKLPKGVSANVFWISLLPSLFFAALVFLLAWPLFPKWMTIKRVLLYFLIAVFVVFGWGQLVLREGGYLVDQISKLNGGVLILVLAGLFLLKIPKFPEISILSTLILLGGFGTFYSKLNLSLDSMHRYMLSNAFIPPLMTSFLISKGLLQQKDKKQFRRSLYLYLSPVVIITVLHLSAGIITQNDFINNYSRHAKNIYSGLKYEIPSITDKTLIYIEGENKNLSMAVGDAFRTGAVPPEEAVAVHYHTDRANILLPSTTGDIIDLLKISPEDLKIDHVYTFIYNGKTLYNTSQKIRQLLQEKKLNYTISPNQWKIKPPQSLIKSNTNNITVATSTFSYMNSTLGIYPQLVYEPNNQILSLLPLKTKVKLKARLVSNIPIPYYHLLHRTDFPSQNLWQEILEWEIGQCQKKSLSGLFECVTQDNKVGDLLNTTKKGKIEISWEYNTEGNIAQDKSIMLQVDLDNLVHDYEFTIPAGGEYLKEIVVSYISFPGEISINGFNLSYF